MDKMRHTDVLKTTGYVIKLVLHMEMPQIRYFWVKRWELGCSDCREKVGYLSQMGIFDKNIRRI